MRARHSRQNNCGGLRRQDEMGAQTPKAAGSSTTPFRSADHSFRPLPTTSPETEGTTISMDCTGSWHGSPKVHDNSSHNEGHRGIERGLQRGKYCPSNVIRSRRASNISSRDIPEQLADFVMDMIPGSDGEELGDAFQFAADLPPITKPSLSELDIHNIITNIKLRHDVNFDRDLSFRPNVEGAKGQEKLKISRKYWKALVAELELYARLFQGSPPLWNSRNDNWSDVVQHAQRRIPKMFETIQEVLRSLVPDRDHARVNDHLDVPMLMQEIEKGVCDLVRLAEWMAHLLKEHCAPMRDDWVDKMVISTRDGVAKNSSEDIVKGLQQLLGILEAMKLDVANHQIRNLKILLIEDTVNFERHYHLDRLVNGRTRVNIDAAHSWYSLAHEEYSQECIPPRDVHRFKLDVFVRAVVSTIFSGNPHCDFPETFYLDQDRLRLLKAEVVDMILFGVCFEMFGLLLREFGHNGPVSHATKSHLRTSLAAIIGEGIGQGPQQWMMNSEPISLELVRQALAVACLPPSFNLDILLKANLHLRVMLNTTFSDHAKTLEATILPQILALVDRHLQSSPIDLFNNLIKLPSPPPSHSPSHILSAAPNHTLSSHFEQFTDLSTRITHIILLHWRVWGPIAYVQDDDMPVAPKEEGVLIAGPGPVPESPSPAPLNTETPVMLKSGEPPDQGHETQLAHEASLP